MALVYKDGKFQDEETARFTAEEYARGHSFFTYMSDTVDSLSSCCFDGSTPVMYVAPDDFVTNKYTVENIESAYEKYAGQTVKVYQETIDTECEPKCTGNWVDAEFVKASAIQEVEIYLTPLGPSLAEDNNILRVTPDHIFPIITRDGIRKDKEAYLLETGDMILFESDQTIIKPEYVEVSEGEWLRILPRKICKVFKHDLKEPKSYYCFKIKNENIQPYFLLPNGCITHNCRLKNKIQTKEFNFTNGNLGVNNLGPLCA